MLPASSRHAVLASGCGLSIRAEHEKDMSSCSHAGVSSANPSTQRRLRVWQLLHSLAMAFSIQLHFACYAGAR